jgi:hypothetical protein
MMLTDERILEIAEAYGDMAGEYRKISFARAIQEEAYKAGMAAAVPEGWKVVPVEPTSEMIDAAGRSKAIDDEGEFPSLYDHIDYSGDNKTRTAIRTALTAALSASPEVK